MNKQAKSHLDTTCEERIVQAFSDEKWIQDFEKILMEEYRHNGPIDRSDLIKAINELDIFIAQSI